MKIILAFAIAATATQPLLAAPAGADYVKMAGAGDLYELTSSEIVLKCAKIAALRDFATMMLTAHARSTAAVAAAAKSDGVPVPPAGLTAEQASNVAQLKAAPTGKCEQVYAAQQIAAHEQALALHTGFSMSGDKPALKAAAEKIVPVVQGHLTEIRSLTSK